MNVWRRLKSEIKLRALSRLKVNILDAYVTSEPCPQNALDIFKGEWVSQLPAEWQHLNAGSITLFADHRIDWLHKEIGGFAGLHVLELGPLEGGHTYQLERMGAAQVTAIEAQTRSYLKCLVIKEILGLAHSRFLCGNFVEYLKLSQSQFDLCVASGVLYHMRQPLELLELLARAGDKLFLWTHYYDETVIRSNADIAAKFSDGIDTEHNGFACKGFRYNYGAAALGSASFCGGSAKFSYWLTRADILAAIRHYGFTHTKIAFEHPDHANGPSFAILAEKSRKE